MITELNRKAIIAVLAACVVAFLLAGYFFFQNILSNEVNTSSGKQYIPPNQSRLAATADQFYLEPTPIPAEEVDGGLWLNLGKNEGYGVVHLETPQDIITVDVGNARSSPLNLILKIFYNYEEVAFQVLGTGETDTEFLFMLESEHSVSIPVHLSEELNASSTVSKLTVGIFLAPEHFAGSNDPFSEDLLLSSGLALNFEIRYDFNRDLVLDASYFKVMEESEFYGFTIHPNSEPPGDGSLRYLSEPLTAKRGEEVELTFFANGVHTMGLQVDNYLIIAMLDWHQIPLNGDLYLWVDREGGNPKFGQHGTFSIEAPSETGFYEFSALLIPNPTRLNSEVDYFPLEMAHRFTLEVIE